jgi:dimethylhistidine N-methyltransferase
VTPADGTPVSRFLTDVLDGLSKTPKRLSPKYFYDREGSLLFDAICELPEYYPTRVELAILEANATAIADACGERVRIVEPGAGSATKTRVLLRALGSRCVEYVPVDVARDHLEDAAARLRADMPALRVTPHVMDFADLVVPPSDIAERTVVFFPGSTIGNFDPAEAQRLLVRFRRVAGDGGAVVVGIDLKKDPVLLHAAYNDSQDVTAAFNKNILVRMNRELGASFDPDAFHHYAFYEPVNGRIEMHLVSARRQLVRIAGSEVMFDEGESICTERSYKYDLVSAERLARGAGLALADTWIDERRSFALLLLRAQGS